MKTLLVLSFISIFNFQSLTADEQKYDERNVIIETIKTNYDQWAAKEIKDESSQNTKDIIPKLIRENDAYQPSEKDEEVTDKSRFSNFTFKILKSQAVVKFLVDNKHISAFLEKKDGRWQLVCAADITPIQ